MGFGETEKKKIKMTEPKKLAPLRILQILKKHSSPENPLLQEKIADYLYDYGIELERKAVGRNLAYLCDAGFPIVSIPKRGYYLEALRFDFFDQCLIIDAILSSKHISAERAKELIHKLEGLTDTASPFEADHVEYPDERNEEDAKQLFDILCYVSSAIGAKGKRQLEFDYEEQGESGDTEKKCCRAIPRRILHRGQDYFLLAYNGKHLVFYRLDRMSHVFDLSFRDKWIFDPGRDLEAEESAIEAFFRKEPHDES